MNDIFKENIEGTIINEKIMSLDMPLKSKVMVKKIEITTIKKMLYRSGSRTSCKPPAE